MPVDCSDTIVLFGGTCSERRVSVASAQNLARYLTDARWWYWAPDGAVQEVTASRLLAHQHPFREDFVAAASSPWTSIETALADAPTDAVFFLALHGGDGENGTLQRELERRALKFTGTGSAGSAAAMDKAEAKRRVAAAGVRVAASHVLDAATDELAMTLARFLDEHGALVAKPLADGSSAGLAFARETADLRAIEVAIRSGGPYLIEAFVVGRELTVGVLDVPGLEAHALPVSEVLLEDGRSFDFEGKYLGAGSKEITPANIPESLAAAAQHVALTAHRVLDCRGYSRTDVIASGDDVTFLETNTLPGLTAASFIPQQLEADGIEMDAFLTGLLERARGDGASSIK